VPKYSIVIPTRNRAHLLENAIRCALSQTVDNYEIVVSDNASSDDTAAVVERLKSPRLRYVKTPEMYPMPDSWEFALSKAQGDWVTYLTDDSGISSHLLAEVESTLAEFSVKAVSWSHLGQYYHFTWQGKEQKNVLIVHPFGRSRRVMNAGDQLKKMYGLAADYTHPVGLNSFCHRSVIETVKKKAGRFFIPPCPDYSSCAALLSAVDRYVYLDLPLGINGIGKESIGMSQVTKRGESSDNFIKEFKEPLLQNVPLSTTVVANYITESLLRVKKAMPQDFKSIEIDWSAYFFHCYIQLGYLEQNSVNIDSEKAELFSVLKRQPAPVKFEFYKELFFRATGVLEIPGKLRNRLRKLIHQVPSLRTLEKTVRKPSTFGGTISGADVGFSNLFEALRYLDTQILT